MFIKLRPLLACLGFFPLGYTYGPNPPTRRPSGLTTYTPSGGVLNGTDFSNWITSKVNNGQKTLALAQGSYNATSPIVDFPYNQANFGAYITIFQLNDLTLWMDDVTIEMPNNTVTSVYVGFSNNVTLYGPTAYWTVPGWSQATITAVAPASGQSSNYTLTFSLDAGYDNANFVTEGALTTAYTGVEFLDPTTYTLKAGAGYSTISGDVTPVSGQPDTYTVQYDNAYFTPTAGTKLAARIVYAMYCTQVRSSNYTTFNDFTMLNCAGFGYFSQYSHRTTWRSCSLKPATFAPRGGTSLPARASSADGMHSFNDYVGPVIDSCYFQGVDDDCIAIQGTLQTTSAAPSGSPLYSFVGSQGAMVGHVLNFYDPTTYQRVCSATVVTTNNSLPNVAPALLTVNYLTSNFTPGTTKYINSNNVGSDYVVQNSQTAGSRGAAAKIKGSNGIIQNNLFELASREGITLGPEFSTFAEGDYVHNVSVLNNIMNNCSYINGARSVLSVHGDVGSEGQTASNLNPFNGNTNVTVDGATINYAGSHGIVYLGAGSDLSITGVEINNYLEVNYTLLELTPNALLNLQNVDLVGDVGVCLGQGGSNPDVAEVKVYGSAPGAPTDLPSC